MEVHTNRVFIRDRNKFISEWEYTKRINGRVIIHFKAPTWLLKILNRNRTPAQG